MKDDRWLICASDGKQVSIEGMYGSLGKLK